MAIVLLDVKHAGHTAHEAQCFLLNVRVSKYSGTLQAIRCSP